MISHVLGKGQGYPIGSGMKGAFSTVEAMLKAHVRDYKPRSSKPKPGEEPEPELMLITLAGEETYRMQEEIDPQLSLIHAIMKMAKRLNKNLGLRVGFIPVAYIGTPDLTMDRFGFIFCPDLMDVPEYTTLSTGPSMNENRNPVQYDVFCFLKK